MRLGILTDYRGEAGDQEIAGAVLGSGPGREDAGGVETTTPVQCAEEAPEHAVPFLRPLRRSEGCGTDGRTRTYDLRFWRPSL